MPLLTFRLPADIDSRVPAKTMVDEHGMTGKMVPKEWLNGIRLSRHTFNTDRQMEAVL